MVHPTREQLEAGWRGAGVRSDGGGAEGRRREDGDGEQEWRPGGGAGLRRRTGSWREGTAAGKKWRGRQGRRNAVRIRAVV